MYEDVRWVYTDGGLMGPNPSKLGGSYAWRWVNSAGDVVGEHSGVITAAWLGLEEVSSNVTELYALADALELLPDGWSGTICSDSQMALGWAFKGWNQTKAHAPSCIRIAQCRERFGGITFMLLGGHPTKAEVERSVRKDGMPVSIHNVWCDKECTRQSREYIKSNPATAPFGLVLQTPAP